MGSSFAKIFQINKNQEPYRIKIISRYQRLTYRNYRKNNLLYEPKFRFECSFRRKIENGKKKFFKNFNFIKFYLFYLILIL